MIRRGAQLGLPFCLVVLVLHRKHETLTQCSFNVGPPRFRCWLNKITTQGKRLGFAVVAPVMADILFDRTSVSLAHSEDDHFVLMY